jgi:hypothetical protein
MVSIEDSIRTFIESLTLDMSSKSQAEKEKILEITRKAIVDLCFAIIPEVDMLVNETGVFQPKSEEHEALMKAYFNEVRKAIFASLTGVAKVKEFVDNTLAVKSEEINSFKIKVDKLDKKISGLTAIHNSRQK